MPKVDMSAKAVTTRLKRVAQLRRLGLSLQNARIKEDKSEVDKLHNTGSHRSEKRKANES